MALPAETVISPMELSGEEVILSWPTIQDRIEKEVD